MAAVRIRVAPLLYSYTGGRKVIDVEGATVGEAIAAIDRLFPGVAFRVIDEQQRIRPHVNIFLGEQSVRDLATPVASGNEIFIVGALSGGCSDVIFEFACGTGVALEDASRAGRFPARQARPL